MNILESIKSAFKRDAPENEKRSTLAEPDDWLSFALGARPTNTGVVVNELNALNSTTVLACVKVISEAVATLPLHLYKRNGASRFKASDHPLYNKLYLQPNEEMTALTFRETLQTHALLWGNAYAYIDWDEFGQVRAIYPLMPDVTSPTRGPDGKIWYLTQVGNDYVKLPKYQVLHIVGLGINGLKGKSNVQMAREAIGLSKAAEEFGSRFFGNDATPGGVLEHPGGLSDKAYRRVKSDWNKMHMGLKNSHKIAILEEGMKYSPMTMPLKDAQFLEIRKMQISEIARIFRVPPHMIGDLDRSTNNNIEHQGIEFVTHTLRSWLVRWEQAIAVSLLTTKERKKYFAKFSVEGFLRGDTKSRYDAYAVGRQWGWLSANDVRALEDQNPIDGGDVYYAPLNMVPIEKFKDIEVTPKDQVDKLDNQVKGQLAKDLKSRREKRHVGKVKSIRSADRRTAVAYEYKKEFNDAVGRIIKKQAKDIGQKAEFYFETRAIDKGPFIKWLKEYLNGSDEYQERFYPVLLSYAKSVNGLVAAEIDVDSGLDEKLKRFIDEYESGFENRYIAESVARINRKIEDAQKNGESELDAVNAEIDSWVETRAQSTANAETIRAGNAVALIMYQNYRKQIRWVTTGESTCPYCLGLEGSVRGAGEPFIMANENYKPDGAEEPLMPSHNIKHAPAHTGCDCQIVAD